MSSQHIYDVPGPRARRRYALMALATVVVVAAAIGFVCYRFQLTGQFSARKWSTFTYPQVWGQIGRYMRATLEAFALSALLALVLGLALAVGRLSEHAWIRVPVVWFVEVFRAVPVLILMMLVYYGLPTIGLKTTPFVAVVAGLTLYNGTVLAEAIRSGVLALPHGQGEAGYALGLRKHQVMAQLLLPQAFRAMLPVIIAQLVVVLKDTALGFLITYKELLYYAKFLGSQAQFDSPIIPSSLVIGTIYVGLCLCVAGLAKLAEKRISGTRDPGGTRHAWGNTNLAIARVDIAEPGAEATGGPR
ncbi:MAG: amino acid ABC transporter permease [Actinomyces sp.]|jgi:glutamate transport system permease protein|nr:amino acid ABC transporter permease [Actinomyces sp.]MCI1640944.1 amino acid ABC transporter permease [Actinomyces sp.]MCI1661312.1 amino acid ABC transporter permease [Actinomyces sp.]MCI1690320.1 amino acid ABC transporter permease [Actinomyces sp.]MCI1786961.1 amino acid ABC transporter permease [Actinomyces sp.]MCI1829473.1 amino acid ABC transporter permease [Actinomyces sp.]